MRWVLFVILLCGSHTSFAAVALGNERNVYLFNALGAGLVQSEDGSDSVRGCEITSAAVAARLNETAGPYRAVPAFDCSVLPWPTVVGAAGAVGVWYWDVAGEVWVEDMNVVEVELVAVPATAVFAVEARDLLGMALVVGWGCVWGVGFIGGQQR